MAGKLPYMPFYVGDWLKEPSLRVCRHEVKGVFIDMLCLMWECDERGVLSTAGRPWTIEEIALAIGGDVKNTIKSVKELIQKNVVSQREDGAVFSRRMVKDQQGRIKENAKKKKVRSSDIPSDVPHNVPHDVPTGLPNDVPDDVPPHPLKYEIENEIEVEISESSETSESSEAEQLFEIYPRRKHRGAALKAIQRALKKTKFEILKTAVEAFRDSQQGKDPQFIPYPATWFNAEGWLDEPDSRPVKKSRVPTLEDLKNWSPHGDD